MPVELRTNDELYNMSWLYSYELSGIRYYFNTPHTTYSTAIKGDYTSIEVASTVGYPNSGKISLGLYSGLAYGGITDYSCFFKYDSKDDTHFYWSGSPQRVWGYEYGAYGKIVRPVIA